MMETTAPTEKRIECQDGTLPYLLARATARGLWLWCKWHKRAHLVTWEELASLQQGLHPAACISPESPIYSA